MNNKHIEVIERQDLTKVIKDLDNLVGDSAVMYQQFENTFSLNAGKTKEEITAWVDDRVSQIGDGIEKITDNARETMGDAATTVMKDVKKGLIHFNAKVQKIANQVPGGIATKVAKYPWVALSFTLSFGFLLGILLKPARRSYGSSEM